MLVLFVFTFFMFGEVSVQATTGDRAYDPAAEEDWVDVTFVADTPAGCHINLQVYWDGVPVRLAFDESRPGNGYTTTVKVEPGVHRIVVMSSSDTEGRYSFRYSGTLDTSAGREFHVLVTDEQGEDAKAEEEDGHDPGSREEAQAVTFPEEFDFTGDETAEAGQITVCMRPCAAVKSVTYTLSGAMDCDIVLSRDHGFEARAYVPAGEYREAVLKEIVLDEDVLADGYTFSFKHAEHPDFYGWTYLVKAGENRDITDLILMMNVNGTVTEADSSLLFAPGLLENRAGAVDEHVMEELREKIPDDYPKETETIPVFIPETVSEEPETAGMNRRAVICIGILAVMVVAFVIVFCRLRKR